MGMRCSCGHENPAGSQFCGSCGISAAERPNSPSLTQAVAAPVTVPGQNGRQWDADSSAATSSFPSAPAEYARSAVRPNTSGPQHLRSIPQGDMTRYLSAAVSFDAGLAQTVVDGILEQPHRAIASTPGVELATVLRYALAARRRLVIRDALLLGALALMVATTLFTFGALAVVTIPLFLFVGWMTILAELYNRFYGLSTKPLRSSEFARTAPPSPPANSYAARQLDRVEEADRAGNVTVYSAFSPFVGYGKVTSSWSFAVDVTSPRREGTRIHPFTVEELYEHVEADLATLDLPGIEVGRRLFVNGRDIRDDQRFLPSPDGPPVSTVRSDLLTSLMADPEERARPYLTISMAGWQGDLVTTTFVRFLLSQSDLFVEAARTAIPPLRPVFKAVDEMEMSAVDGEFSAMFKSSFLQTIPLLLHSPAAIIHRLKASARREETRRKLRRRPDYGALISMREAAADTHWQRYFQVFDHDRYIKVIEQRMFRSLTTFLRDHNVDVSALVSQAEVIVNNGTMITGSTVTAHQIAGGTGSKATGLSMPFRGDGGGKTAA